MAVLQRRFQVKNLIDVGSTFLTLMGIGALLAWLLQWRAFLRIVPGMPVTPCDTALGYILAGIGLRSLLRDSLRQARGSGIVLALFGGTYLLFGLSNVWFSIHSLFPAFTARVIAPLPLRDCRVTIATDIAFLLLGAFLVLMSYVPRERYLLNLAAFFASTLPALGVLGGILSISRNAGQHAVDAHFLSMSLLSAICAFVAGISACALFWMRTEQSDRRLSSTAATLTLVGLLVLFAGVNSAVVAHGHLAIDTTVKAQNISQQINLIQGVVESIRKAETAQRDFLLTSSDQYRLVYQQALREIDHGFATLRRTNDGDVDRLRGLAAGKMAGLAATIDLPRQQALAIVASGADLSEMDQIDAESSRLILSLRNRLTERLSEDERSTRLVQRTVILSSAVAAIMMLLGIAFLRMEVRRRTLVEAELRESTRGLQGKVEERTCEIRKYSEELRAEVARRQEASDQLRVALDLSRVVAWTWHADADQTVLAGPVEELFGVPADRLNSHGRFRERVIPSDRAIFDAAVADSMREKRKFDTEFRMFGPNGDIRWIEGIGDASFDEKGQVVRVAGVNLDISERKRIAHQLENSERHFREMADAMPQIIWKSSPTGEVIYCNARWYEYVGETSQRNQLVSWETKLHPDDRIRAVAGAERGFSSGEPFDQELRLRRACDGEYRWFLARSVPYRDAQGNLLHWFGTATDISEQKYSEAQLEEEVRNRTATLRELAVKEGQLIRSLAEKDTLFHEMHHRVKNNLQVVSSLLRMQSEVLKDPAAAAALKESHQRVLSMALIHEQLYTNQQLAEIDFEAFAQKLSSELFHSYAGREEDRVTCRLNTEKVYLKIDHAIPLGLILNELVTNALKYAYPRECPGGEVVIDLHEGEHSGVTLRVSDHGVGLPDDLDWRNSDSMGLPIVDLLTQQMGGSLKIHSKPGAAFTIEFFKEAHKADAATV